MTPTPPREPQPAVSQLRVVVTVDDFEQAIAFFRDALGLPQSAVFSSEAGQVVLLEAGRATLEITDRPHAEFIDAVEVGRRVAGRIRLAFEVPDSAAKTDELAAAGASVVAPPTRTPWDSLNARLDAPAGLHITVFQELDETAERGGPE